MQGLRTLVLATRILDEQQYQEWNGHYELAASSLADREARIAAEAEKIERGLELVGVTAIEDKLQEGVPQAINSLITANIKVPPAPRRCSANVRHPTMPGYPGVCAPGHPQPHHRQHQDSPSPPPLQLPGRAVLMCGIPQRLAL